MFLRRNAPTAVFILVTLLAPATHAALPMVVCPVAGQEHPVPPAEDSICAGAQLSQSRQFNTFSSGPIEAHFKMPEEAIIDRQSFHTGADLLALVDTQRAKAWSHPGARITPQLAFHLQGSDAISCWPDETVNGRMQLWAGDTLLGALAVGDRDYLWPLLGKDGSALWQTAAEGDSIVLSTTFEIRDASGQSSPSAQRLPNDCVLTLSAARITFDAAQIGREAALLTREARLVSDTVMQAALIPVRTLGAIAVLFRNTQQRESAGGTGAGPGSAMLEDIEDFLCRAQPFLSAPEDTWHPNMWNVGMWNADVWNAAISDLEQCPQETGLDGRSVILSPALVAQLVGSAFVQRHDILHRTILGQLAERDFTALHEQLSRFRALQSLGWTLGLILDPGFLPSLPQSEQHLFSNDEWVRLNTAEVQ